MANFEGLYTADHLPLADCETVYFINLMDLRVDAYKLSELQNMSLFGGVGYVGRKDRNSFDELTEVVAPSTLYGTKDAVKAAFLVDMNETIKHHEAQIKIYREAIVKRQELIKALLLEAEEEKQERTK